MKIFFSLIIFCSIAFCDYIVWQNDFDKVLMQAKKEQKEILLLLLKRDCIRCKTVFSDIFADKEVQEKVNQKYLPVAVFFEENNSYPIELFYTQQFPAIFFVSKDDESYLQTPLSGNFTKRELLDSL
ncbi:MAG: thioredoxin family protein [Sulfurimonas sp.]|nr:thioredoxin family protein [Sulfurimonas sp.]